MKSLSPVVVACLLPLSGCGLIGGDASLSDMTPGMSEEMDKLECWLTIEFKNYPDGINPRDVKVVFSSIALFDDQSFDWPYIAAHDQIAQGLGKGYRPNEESQADQSPPLNVDIKVNYPLRARPRLELDLSDTITLRADLYWGGKKQDSISKPIEHVYQRTLE